MNEIIVIKIIVLLAMIGFIYGFIKEIKNAVTDMLISSVVYCFSFVFVPLILFVFYIGIKFLIYG